MKLSNVRLTRVAATLALAGLALTACGGDDEDAGDDTAAATADDGATATADEAEATAAEEPTAEGRRRRPARRSPSTTSATSLRNASTSSAT